MLLDMAYFSFFETLIQERLHGHSVTTMLFDDSRQHVYACLLVPHFESFKTTTLFQQYLDQRV